MRTHCQPLFFHESGVVSQCGGRTNILYQTLFRWRCVDALHRLPLTATTKDFHGLHSQSFNQSINHLSLEPEQVRPVRVQSINHLSLEPEQVRPVRVQSINHLSLEPLGPRSSKFCVPNRRSKRIDRGKRRVLAHVTAHLLQAYGSGAP